MITVVPQVRTGWVRTAGGMCMGQDIGGVTPKIQGCMNDGRFATDAVIASSGRQSYLHLFDSYAV